MLHTDLSPRRGTKPATRFLRELKDQHNAENAKFLVDDMEYLTAIDRIDLDSEFNYSAQGIIEKLFQTIST